MFSRLAIILLSTQILLLAGCSYLKYPDVHKLTIIQGNILNQEMIDKLRPGLSRSQVRYILGTPLIANTFDQSRWDYFFSINPPGRDEQRERVSIYFNDDELAYFTGDYLPSNIATALDSADLDSPDIDSEANTENQAPEAFSVEASAIETSSIEASSAEPVRETPIPEASED